jgi:hypothetical protein
MINENLAALRAKRKDERRERKFCGWVRKQVLIQTEPILIAAATAKFRSLGEIPWEAKPR